MDDKDTLLSELDQLAAIQRYRRAGKILAIVTIAAAATATRTAQPSVAVAIAVVALIMAGLCHIQARQLTRRFSSPEKSKLGAYASAYQAAKDRPAAPPEPEPVDSVGPVVDEPVALTVVLDESASFSTADGERLDLPAGPHPARFRLSFAPERSDGDEIDYPVFHFEIDADGATWRSRTYLDPDCLTFPVTDPELARASGLRFWRDVPAAWREAFEKGVLIAGVSGLLDSRDRFELPVGDGVVTMMLKHQGPQTALAWLPDEERLVARVSGMYYETWKEGEFEDIVDGVELGYVLDPTELLPLGKPEWHYREWGDWWEEVSPRPPVFERDR